MLSITPANIRLWSVLGARGAYGQALLALAADMENLIVLSADVGNSSGLRRFRETYPDKFVNVGIAEQNMVGMAAGFAKEGFTVFASSLAPFASMRACEQIRLNLGYMKQNVIVTGISSGMIMGHLGNTHCAMEDAAIMRSIPNMTVVTPADGMEVVKTVQTLAREPRAVYLRLTGTIKMPIIYKADYDFSLGKAVVLREGTDVALFSCGIMVNQTLIAADILEKSGLSVLVVNMHTLKPLDTEIIDHACSKARLLVSVEEHSVVGGLGSAIAEYTARRGGAPKQCFIGLPDNFGPAGDHLYLLQKYGLTGKQIAKSIMTEL